MTSLSFFHQVVGKYMEDPAQGLVLGKCSKDAQHEH